MAVGSVSPLKTVDCENPGGWAALDAVTAAWPVTLAGPVATPEAPATMAAARSAAATANATPRGRTQIDLCGQRCLCRRLTQVPPRPAGVEEWRKNTLRVRAPLRQSQIHPACDLMPRRTRNRGGTATGRGL